MNERSVDEAAPIYFGEKLTLLSVGELNERIALLKEEIARLEADIRTKQASKSAADLFFKK